LGRLTKGQRVLVSFNRRNCVGFVVGLLEKSAFPRLNFILELLDAQPVFDEAGLALVKEISSYYGCSIGESFEVILPPMLRKAKSYSNDTVASDKRLASLERRTTLIIDAAFGEQSRSVLLSKIKEILAKGLSVIILAPEVSVLIYIEKILRDENIGPLAVMGRTQSPADEFDLWNQMKTGQCRVAVGLRSAVFLPVPCLGLIVILDEEHMAYKQEQSPHYHSREVALMRQRIEGGEVIFTSRAPSAELWERAKKKKWERLDFIPAHPAQLQIVDMTNYNPQKSSILSVPLQLAMNVVLEKQGKVLLFINRRGFGSVTRCNHCGLTIQCPRCDVTLTYLFSKKTLVCRRCNYEMEVPRVCPRCQQTYVRSTGIGIEKIESEAARLFPQAHVSRYDRDTKDFPAEANILIVTQAVFRFWHLLHPDLSAVLAFDEEVSRLDFRSAQKAFGLLVSLRECTREKVIVQSRITDQYCLQTAQTLDFQKFYQKELNIRRELGFPPFLSWVEIHLRGAQEDKVFTFSRAFVESLEKTKPSEIEIVGLYPDMIAKLRDKYRYTILLKGKSVKVILKYIRPFINDFRGKKGIIVTLNVDP
jgi:primosomal protein N' (replication factor Y) (superfamily II helicase)